MTPSRRHDASAARQRDAVTRVLYVGDDDVLARRTRAALATAPAGPWLVDRRETVDEALAALRAGGHDVCLVDLRVGGGRALDFLRAARARGVHLPTVVLADGPLETRGTGVDVCMSSGLVGPESLADALSLALRRAA